MSFRQQSIVAIGMWLLLPALAMMVSKQYPLRWDVSADERHTLSRATTDLLNSVESPLEIRAYLPTHIPAPYSVIVDAIRDGLADYGAACPQPVRILIEDPQDPGLSKKEQALLEEQARGYGLKKAELEVIQGDRQVRQSVWLGIALLYQDRQVVVPPIEKPEQLEYAMARALREVIRGPAKRPGIGFTVGHGEPDLMQTPIRSMLESSGTIRVVDLSGNTVPGDIDALVLVAPRKPLNARAQFVIDQFLMRGGSLVALLDYRSQSTVFPDVLVPTKTGLETLLESYGARIETEQTVVDRDNRTAVPIKRNENGKIVMGPHPLYARAHMNPHPIGRGISELITPMASPITLVRDGRSDFEGEVLAMSVPGTVLRKDVRQSQPDAYAEKDLSREVSGPAPVAVALTGTFRSVFTTGDRPVNPLANAPDRSQYRPDPSFLPSGQRDARIVVVTSGGRLLSSSKAGLMFLQNAIDWVVADTSLSSIRAREAEDPPLENVSDSARWFARAGTIVGPALLLLGLSVFIRRRRVYE